MFVYYNIKSIDTNNITLLSKIKNKISNGYFYKLNYDTNKLSIDNLIIHINIKNYSEYNKFLNLEINILNLINVGRLNPVYNFNNFVKKHKNKAELIIKICGIYTNNYNYGLIYKLFNTC